VAGCGSGTLTTSASSTPSSPAPIAGSTTATGATVTRSASTTPGAGDPALAFAECMRASGVPNFPDPQPGGGLLFNAAGVNPAAPAVRAAQAKCHKLLPKGGPPAPGSTTHPSAQTLEKLLAIAGCMRRHGVPDFPDPRTSIPVNPFAGGRGVITDYDGAILLFPSTLNPRSPAYMHAAAACGPLAQKLGTGPH
jgi:hypothetical protein